MGHVLRFIDGGGGEGARHIVNPEQTSTEPPFAVVGRTTLLDLSQPELSALGSLGPRVLLRSGAPRTSTSDSEVSASIRSWSPAGRDLIDRAITGALEIVGALGARLALWPAANDAVSDVPSCLDILRRFAGIEMVVQPRDLLVASMIAHGAEHIERIFDVFEDQPRVVAIADGCEMGVPSPELPRPVVRVLRDRLDRTHKPVILGSGAIA